MPETAKGPNLIGRREAAATEDFRGVWLATTPDVRQTPVLLRTFWSTGTPNARRPVQVVTVEHPLETLVRKA